jgi:hypothetical protein
MTEFSRHWLLLTDFLRLLTTVLDEDREMENEPYVTDDELESAFTVVRSIINENGDYVDYAVVGGSYDTERNEFVILAVDQAICASKSQEEILDLATNAMILDSKEAMEARGYDWKKIKEEIVIEKEFPEDEQ